MPGDFFNHSYFLQAVGWGILHSFWQAALMWLVYKTTTAGNQKASACFKYNLSLCCLSGSFLWFVLTIASYYFSFRNGIVLPVQVTVISNRLLPLVNGSLLAFVSVAYLLLLGFYAIRFGRQYYSLYKYRTVQLCKAPVEIRLFTQQAALHIGIKKNVQIWLSQKTDAPFVTGFFKPMILLPFSLLNNLTTTEAEAVILHELAHIKRNDYLLNLFQLAAEKILFFNPFARLLSEAAKQEREHCCDDWVLNFRYSHHEYAHALLQVEQLRNQQLLLAMNATSGKKNLLKRIKRIFAVTPVTAITNIQQLKLIGVGTGMMVLLIFLVPVTKQTISLSPAAVVVSPPLPANAFSLRVLEIVPVKRQETVSVINNSINVKSAVSKPEPRHRITEPAAVADDGLTDMFVNEELLETPAEPAMEAMQITNQLNSARPETVMVKVEEEQAGSLVKKVYYIQLNNHEGQTAIKPLAMIKEIMVADTAKSVIKNPVKAFKGYTKQVKKLKAI